EPAFFKIGRRRMDVNGADGACCHNHMSSLHICFDEVERSPPSCHLSGGRCGGGASFDQRRLFLASGLGAVLLFGLAVAGAASETKTYTYDALGRLVKAQSSGTVNNLDTNSICYDPAGNRTQYKSNGAGGALNCGSGSSNNPPI